MPRVAEVRRAALAVLGVVAGLALLSTGAAASGASSRVHDAFAKLESHLRHAHGLGKHERARLLGTARLAEKRETQQHRACDALAILEDLRRAIARSAAPDTGAVTKVEVAILHTARGAACGYRARSVTIEPQGFGGGPKPLKRVPATPDEEHANPRAGAGTGPRPGPPTNVIPVPPGHEFATGSSPFAFSTITDLRSPYLSAPEEPTEASAGQVVWYTGNNGDAFSVDGGATFKKVDPRRMFPEGDTAFCCDQVVVYAPRINRFIWYMQYWCPAPDTRCDELGSTNQVRLAVASPQALLAHRGDPAAAWRVWAIAPRDVRRRHDWFDYPALGLGRHSLYLTSNIYHGHPGESAGRFTGGLIGRVSLAELAKGRGFKLDYRVDHDLGDFRPVQGVGTRGFVTTHASLTELLTFSWDERSPLLLAHRTRHSVIANADYESLSSGFDWDARTNERVLTAARRRDELWLAWSEGRSICRATGSCDPFWPQPHIHVVVVDRNTYRLRHERFIHNPDYAISYPSLAVDSRGRVGMSFSYGGGSAGNASTAAGFLTGGEVFRQVATNPQAGYQGDYFALRQDWPATGRFTGSGYVMGAGAGGSQVVRRLFYRYSR